MADKEVEHPTRGNEWEVVSLTSSAYAASPGPYNVESRRDERKSDHAYYGAETSRDLFMSDHFVFPPSQHEDLPLDDQPVFQEEGSKDSEDLMPECQGLSDEQSLYGEPALGSSRQYMESAMYDDHSEPAEYAEEDLNLRSDTAKDTLGHEKDAKNARHDLPCEAWWRRRAVSMYIRTREANAMWSLFFAAAVTGLVVLGQRWQQERWQVLQLKWHSSISSEKLSRVLEPLSRLKGVIVRGNPQASLVRSATSSEI
ncbi:hypothetical protein Rs2_32155 [Raphanus sativus]|uniref:ATG8-interacting protein 1 n=1 Tax=Raphanus sativus TaxID=3726 RepID=A0A6J0JM01_RAPSA|nr:ATG8-interacting protein 1 [Raphanus sativus]XP_056844845.1 ATG8-interacting protein 1 [Raphanus sativus]KAJ4892407.1 hypothetical protein Rs2_32155 [Raphanus sativus]